MFSSNFKRPRIVNATRLPDDLVGTLPICWPIARHRRLVVYTNNNTTVFITADELLVTNAARKRIVLEGVSVSAAITSSGANGLDTGSEASSTWYYIWVVYGTAGVAALLSTSKTIDTITLPAGYTYGALVGADYNDATPDLVEMYQQGYEVQTERRLAASSLSLTGGDVWNEVDCSSYFPDIATMPIFDLRPQASAGNAWGLNFGIDNAGSCAVALVGSNGNTGKTFGRLIYGPLVNRSVYIDEGTNTPDISEMGVIGWRYD